MNYKAVGNYVVLRAVEETAAEDKLTENGVIIPAMFNEKTTGQIINNPNKDGKIRVRFYIDSIGSGVDKDCYSINIGDEVIVNDYDVQTQGGDNDEVYGLCKVESIKAVVER